ncbi:MAG: hypothetical protein VKS61_12230 [Candidatus Sericytochromatia bacterium]|nr:hypothetical protein [Candidatus Sericytochromatia bacterium]
MNRQAGGRPAKSGARREVKSFRLVPEAIARLERLRQDRGGSTSDVLNDVLLGWRHAELLEPARAPRLGVIAGHAESEAPRGASLARFRVLPGRSAEAVEDAHSRVGHELERLRDGLGAVLGEIEGLMAEQLSEGGDGPSRKGARALDAYGQGFKDGMLEALETAYALLQAELLMSEGFATT